MSRHEGVSCDSCMKANFRGRRYKCLVCFDYDLCSTCYEAGATTTRHTIDHAMQCILTRSDFDLYYGGEAVSAEQPQSFVCPYCGKMGYTDTTLQDHVAADHPESPAEVVCPICAALPGGDPNHVTDDFAAHLQLEHRAARDFEEPMGIRHVRRIPHPSRGGARTRRSNMQFHTASGGAGSGVGGGAGALAVHAPSSRETMDPIAELLSQLSSVRSRAAAAQSVSSQLQQLEMQLQSTRQQLERLPRRPAENKSATNSQSSTTQPQNMNTTLLDYAGAVMSTGAPTSSKNNTSDYLLSKIGDTDLSEVDKQGIEVERADRSIFVQELLLSSMSETLRLSDDTFSYSSSTMDSYGADGILNGEWNDNVDNNTTTSMEGDDLGNAVEGSGCSESRRDRGAGGNSNNNSSEMMEGGGGGHSKVLSNNVEKVAKSGLEKGSSNSAATNSISAGATASASNLLGIAHSNTVTGGMAVSSNIASSSSLPKEKVLNKVKAAAVASTNLEKDNTSSPSTSSTLLKQ